MYCLAGVLVAASAMVVGIYFNPQSAAKWIALFAMSAFVFGNAIRYSKALWTSRRFWALIGLFIVVHFALAFAFLLHASQVKLASFAIAGVAEYFVLDAYLSLFLSKSKSPDLGEKGPTD